MSRDDHERRQMLQWLVALPMAALVKPTLAQAQGQERWYAEFVTRVAKVERARRFEK